MGIGRNTEIEMSKGNNKLLGGMKLIFGNGIEITYHNGEEIRIKSDGTVLCFARDTDGKTYCAEHKMPMNKIEVSISNETKNAE